MIDHFGFSIGFTGRTNESVKRLSKLSRAVCQALLCQAVRLAGLVASAACWLLASAAAADEASPGLHLMRPDSLAGWDYGSQPPDGWTIQGGTLTGDPASTPLLSGFTFGDFQLRFAWTVENEAAWEISLPEAPSRPGVRLTLGETASCGRAHDGDRLLAPGGPVPRIPGGTHNAQLDRAGDRLALSIDGRQLWQASVAKFRRFGLGLAVRGGRAQLSDLRLKEPAGEPMFNGKDLSGWWTPGDKNAWKVENGQIVLDKEGGNYLRSQDEFANFTLSLEYKIRKDGNSGVGIRTPRQAWPSGDGMEIQIWDVPYDRPLDKHAPGALYGNVPPLARADKTGQFNRMVIKADGRMISVWMNDELVQQCYTGNHPELKHRHLKGWIGLQDHNARTEFRNIRLLEAPPGLGLDAWRTPRTPHAGEVVVDHLMNSEQLAVADGVRGGVVRARVDGKNRAGHVLAELAGPGAVVRLVRTREEGRLEFYFDGESEPRLKCKPGDLWQAAPQLSEDANPVLTCLSYRKSLKIVLRGAAGGNWWIDYATFPATVRVESYATTDAHVPRGWLAAAVYRHEQFGWGVHREFDPWPRPDSGPKTLQPGKRELMLRLDGAGIVHWVKLAADRHVLDNNDLWLEVRVDGHQEPAVAAPVRFWFPGLAGGGNYPNFVLVDREGMTNTLAMPFGEGIDLALHNRGKRPIQGVRLGVSLEPATDKTRESLRNPMRLHAVFEPAGKGKELARCESRGRWIGLVYEEPKGPKTALEALSVDGEAVKGWKGSSLDEFLGRSGDFRSSLSGRHGPLAWRYLLLAPVDFQKSFRLTAAESKLGNRLAIFYADR